MRESGDWFSPEARPETLTSDDPLEKVPPQRRPRPSGRPVAAVRTLGRVAPAALARAVPASSAVGRAVRGAAVAPARAVGELPTTRQVAGMWAGGAAVVAATGLPWRSWSGVRRRWCRSRSTGCPCCPCCPG